MASKGAEFHQPKLTEMVCFRNGRWVSWGPKLRSINARKNLEHSRGHSGKAEIHH